MHLIRQITFSCFIIDLFETSLMFGNCSSATCHHISASSYTYISCKLHSNANEEAGAELKQTAITARA